MKLTKVGQANSVMLEVFEARSRQLVDDSPYRQPRFAACWEWKGATRRKGRFSTLAPIGRGYVVMTDNGEVFKDGPTDVADQFFLPE